MKEVKRQFGKKKKICSHLFKTGETFILPNNRLVPILIGLPLTANSDVLVWFTILSGNTVTDKNPTLLGNTAFKFIMASNASLTTAGDKTYAIKITG
jgi:hypothetical protein